MKLDVLKPWIGKRVAEFIGMEDDVVVEFIFNQLEAKVKGNSVILHLIIRPSVHFNGQRDGVKYKY